MGSGNVQQLASSRWRIRWTDEHGKRRSATFDAHRDAVFELRRRQAKAEEARRGIRQASPASERTFGELCDYWLQHRCPVKKTGVGDRRIIERYLRPRWGHRRLRDVGTEDLDAFKRDLLARGLKPATVRNYLALVVAMWNVAVRDLKWVGFAPRVRMPRVRFNAKDYRYLKTRDEISRFLAAARDRSPLVHALYAAAVWTGARAGELCALRWEDVDLDRRMISIWRGPKGTTKGDDLRRVPILDPLLPVLRDWRSMTGPTGLVFPNSAGTMHRSDDRIFQETLRQVLRAADLPDVEVEGKVRGYISFHGLRHTFASHWMMAGGDLFKLQRILGHKDVQLTLRYSHLAPNAFEGDFGRLGSAAE